MDKLKQLIESNIARKAQVELLLNAYNDKQAQAIQKELEQLFQGKECFDRLKAVCINITQKITNRLASVYCQNATRLINGAENDKVIFDFFQTQAGLGIKLKQANKISKLTGNALARILIRNGIPCVDVIAPNLFDVVTGSSPDDVQGVIITNNQSETYIYWTAEQIITYDKNYQEISSQENPYKILPFVSIFNQSPLDDYFQNGLNSLLTVQEAINLRLSDLCYLLNYQSFAVGVLTGSKQKTGNANSLIEVGAGSFLQLPQGSKFEFVSPQAPIDDTLKAIDFIIKQCAVAHGLPADSMSIEVKAESGLSKIVSSAELTENRLDQVALFALYEQQIFNVFKTVWNYHNPKSKLSDKASLVINFADLQTTTTPLDKAKEWQLLLEMGLMSQVDILQAKDPDLTREQAQAKLLQVKDDLEEFYKKSSL